MTAGYRSIRRGAQESEQAPPVASYRTAAFSGVCAVIPHGFNLPAKLKKFSVLRGF